MLENIIKEQGVEKLLICLIDLIKKGEEVERSKGIDPINLSVLACDLRFALNNYAIITNKMKENKSEV